MIPTWDNYFLSILDSISKRSKDPNTQTASVIVGPDNSIRCTGYNSFPRGIDDTVVNRFERPEKYFWFEHGERNAIYTAAKIGVPLDGCRLYVTGYPCMDCARAIVQVGIVEVIFDKARNDNWIKSTPKYGPDFERMFQLFKEAGVIIRGVEI